MLGNKVENLLGNTYKVNKVNRFDLCLNLETLPLALKNIFILLTTCTQYVC
jgi:hypothetical protein